MSSQADARLGAWSYIGFNGQLHEPATAWQSLGNGYRTYNQTLKRFHSPDALSPFDKGGINAYAYCGNDPQNRSDPSGHFAVPWALLSGGLALVGAGAIVGGAVADGKAVKGVLLTLGAIAMIGAAAVLPVGGRPLFGHARNWRKTNPSTPQGGALASGSSASSGPSPAMPRRHSVIGSRADRDMALKRHVKAMDGPWQHVQSAPTTPRGHRAPAGNSFMPLEKGISAISSSSAISKSSYSSVSVRESLRSIRTSTRSSGGSGTELDGIARWLEQQRNVRAISHRY